MSFNYSPTIVTDGLVMYLDATNTKSLADVPSQNLMTWSEDFTNGTWGKSNLTVSGNTTTSPIGTSTADSLIENSLLAQHAITKTVTVTSGNTFTYSIYLKPNSRFNSSVYIFDSSYTNGFGGNFNLTAGTVTTLSQGTGVNAGTNQITNVGDGWYRCKITGTIPTVTSFNIAVYLLNNSGVSNYSGDGISNLFLWGAQLEIGPVATTYIPTTTVAVSRTPTWVDLSRGGNNGTLIGGLTYNYSNGGSLVFDGVNDYVSVPSLANTSFPQDAGTISVWYNIDSTGQIATNPSIFDGYDSRNHIFIRRSSNPLYTIQVAFQDVSYAYRYVYTHLSTLDVWHNIVVTYVTGINSSVKLYIDGILINSGTISDSAWRPTQQLVGIGTIYANSTVKGKGSILQIYNRALSASEVLQNYNTTKSRFGL